MKIRTERIGVIVAVICIIMLNVLVWYAAVKTVSLEQNNDTDAVTETTTCVVTTTEEETTTCLTTTTTTSLTATTTSTTSYTTETQTQTTTSETTTETSRQTTTTEETANTYTITTTYENAETTTTWETTWKSQMTYLGKFTGTYYKGITCPCNGGSGRILVSCYEKYESYKGSVASRFVYDNYGYYVNDKTMVYIEFEKYPQLNGWYSVDDCNADKNVVDFYFADYSTCPWQTAGVTTVSVWICA